MRLAAREDVVGAIVVADVGGDAWPVGAAAEVGDGLLVAEIAAEGAGVGFQPKW